MSNWPALLNPNAGPVDQFLRTASAVAPGLTGVSAGLARTTGTPLPAGDLDAEQDTALVRVRDEAGIAAAATRHLQIAVHSMPCVEMLALAQSLPRVRVRVVGPAPAADGFIDAIGELGLSAVDEQAVRDTWVGAQP